MWARTTGQTLAHRLAVDDMSIPKPVPKGFCERAGRTALAIAVVSLLPVFSLRPADQGAAEGPPLLERVLSAIVPANLRSEISLEAQTFVNDELKISAEELEEVRTFIVPRELVEGMLSDEENKNGTLAYFYMFREQMEETKEPILTRMRKLSKDQDKRRLAHWELEQFFDRLATKVYGSIPAKKQYAILILARRDDEDTITRDYRILHELKHHTQDLPVYFSKSTGDVFEEEATAFQMEYLAAARGMSQEQVIEKCLGGGNAKQAGMKKREFDASRRLLVKIWEEQVRPKLNAGSKQGEGTRPAN